MRLARSASWLWGMGLVLALAPSCKHGDETDHGPPPPPPPPATSGAGQKDVCAGGGGQNPDALSAEIAPRMAGGFCLDPQGEVRTYGDQGKLSMDDVCTTAFDGECEVYKRFGLDRVVVLHYVDATGAPNSVDVNLSRFKSVDGAYGMFTERVIADGDPARLTVRELPAGGAGALSSSNAYVWRGPYLAELTFVSDDPKLTPEAMSRANEQSTGVLAKAIGDKVPAPATLPPAAALLPAAARINLGIAYYPADAPGLPGLAPLATGYFSAEGKRWRDVAIVRGDAQAAAAAFRLLRTKSASTPLKGIGDEAVAVVLQEAADRPKAEYVVARAGKVVLAIGDEELVLDPALASDKLAALKLTRDEKQQKLREWLAAQP